MEHDASSAAAAKKHSSIGVSNADELADSYEQMLRTAAAKPNTGGVNGLRKPFRARTFSYNYI